MASDAEQEEAVRIAFADIDTKIAEKVLHDTVNNFKKWTFTFCCNMVVPSSENKRTQFLGAALMMAGTFINVMNTLDAFYTQHPAEEEKHREFTRLLRERVTKFTAITEVVYARDQADNFEKNKKELKLIFFDLFSMDV